ncbi:unnamed protein product [Closterium sp. Yama58-4]|nr:unnamed protein product [Closterium sp. Yama58-4]
MTPGSPAYPAILAELGAGRQVKNDFVASVLVQVLGVKESADLQEGFGFFVQDVLSGGLEKAHGERRGGAEGRAAEKMHEEGEGGTGGEGMYVSGVSATDFALAFAIELSKPEHCAEACMHIFDGNNVSKVRVEEAAIEEARSRLRKRIGDKSRIWGFGRTGGEGTAADTSGTAADTCGTAADTCGTAADMTGTAEALAMEDASAYSAAALAETRAFTQADGTGSSYSSGLVPVNSSPVLAAFTSHIELPAYYSGFDHLPSLLLRLGAIPKPLHDAQHPMEWEEWPQGDEAVVKLPDDPNVRFVQLGIVEENMTVVGSGHMGAGVTEQASKSGRKHVRGKGRRAKASGQGSEVRGGDTNRGLGKDRGGFVNASGMAVAQPPRERKLPIVRCVADADYIVEAVGLIVSPPACVYCSPCFRSYNFLIPSIALIAKFAYRPLHVLFNRFVSVFPPHSFGFNTLVKIMGLSPLPPRPSVSTCGGSGDRGGCDGAGTSSDAACAGDGAGGAGGGGIADADSDSGVAETGCDGDGTGVVGAGAGDGVNAGKSIGEKGKKEEGE